MVSVYRRRRVAILASAEVPVNTINHAITHKTGFEWKYGMDKIATNKCGAKIKPNHHKIPPDTTDDTNKVMRGNMAKKIKNHAP